jgi:hypothetical protein
MCWPGVEGVLDAPAKFDQSHIVQNSEQILRMSLLEGNVDVATYSLFSGCLLFSRKFVGAPGFEPGASCSQSTRANRTALRPDI